MAEGWANKSILVVDDSKKVIAALRMLYREIGLNVVGEATNGVEALAEVKRLRPDIVSLDIIMPEMDGIECYRRLRDSEDFSENRPKTFFVTYLATEPKILEAYKDEIPEYLFLAKNYSRDSIRNTLNRLHGIAEVNLKIETVQEQTQDLPASDPELSI